LYLRTGSARFEILLNRRPVANWTADGTLPPAVIDKNLDGHTSTRFTVSGIPLAPGDTLMLRGTPDGGEPAPVDYIEITPGER